MQLTKRIAICFCLVLLGVLVARADDWDKKTIFTFNAPAEIPGEALTPDTYVFKVFDSTMDRYIGRIWNKDETELVATLLAIPDNRLTPSDKPIITSTERAKNAPLAIRAWFYPGDDYGFAFVYPKSKATELAAANHQSVPSMSNSMTSQMASSTNSKTSPGFQALEHTHVTAITPDKKEVEVGHAIQTKPSSSSNQPQ